jgi:ATP-dependent RNA helicase DDX3X
MPEVETECNLDAYDDIPVEASGEECPAPIEAFADVTLHPLLKANIELNKFAKPTPVQRHSLPVGIARRDLMACAQTGSGKTGGFLFPVLHQMLTEFDEKPDEFKQRSRAAEPRCLILAPTRELATQILRETQKFAQQSPVQPVVVYGGADIRMQISQLERGCSLLVATPGRLCDQIERGKVSLTKVRFLVLDEA